MYVHLSTDGSWVGGRGAIPASLAAKFACDGVVQPVWEVDGTPVSVGRRQRIVPARTRRLVEDRDRGCVFPGCQARGFLEVHHLDHWADGGATDLDRLVCLCPFHHDAHHRGEFTITGRPTSPAQLVRPTSGARAGLVFTTARGRTIGPDAAQAVVEGVGPREHVGDAYRGPTGESYRASTGEAYRGPTGERLHARWLDLPANRSPRRPGLTVVPNVVPNVLPNVSPTDDPSPPGDP